MPTKSSNTAGRGGKIHGAGRKKKSNVEKTINGNPGGRTLEVLDIPEMEGSEMLEPHDFYYQLKKMVLNYKLKKFTLKLGTG